MIYDGNATKDFEKIIHTVIIDYFKTTYLLNRFLLTEIFIFVMQR